MLYSSFMRSLGPGLIWSYGPEAQAIAVGSTGGAPDIPGHPRVPALSWDELQRDLIPARRWTNDLYIHSLEGCVERGFIEHLRSMDWGQAPSPPAAVRTAARLRRLLRATLWMSAHPWRVFGAGAASTWIWSRRHLT